MFSCTFATAISPVFCQLFERAGNQGGAPPATAEEIAALARTTVTQKHVGMCIVHVDQNA